MNGLKKQQKKKNNAKGRNFMNTINDKLDKRMNEYPKECSHPGYKRMRDSWVQAACPETRNVFENEQDEGK